MIKRDDDEFVSPSSSRPDASQEQKKERAAQRKLESKGKLSELRRDVLKQQIEPAAGESDAFGPEGSGPEREATKRAQQKLERAKAEDANEEKQGILEGDTEVTEERLIDQAKSEKVAKEQAEMEQQDEAA